MITGIKSFKGEHGNVKLDASVDWKYEVLVLVLARVFSADLSNTGK